MSTKTIRPRFSPPETRLLLFPSGLILDSSGFRIAFADGETPSTVGAPALRLRKVEAVIADALERAWNRVADKVEDNGERLVVVTRDGAPCLIPLEQLRYIELAAILSSEAA